MLTQKTGESGRYAASMPAGSRYDPCISRLPAICAAEVAQALMNAFDIY